MRTNSLDKAIKLHEEHMEDPKTATVKSQQLLMDLLLKHAKEMSLPATLMGGRK